MSFITVLGLTAGILTSSSLLPQVIKTIKEKKAEDLSVVMFITLMAGLIIWVVYGILKNDMPIIITNGFSVLLNIFILILKYKYSNNK